MPWSETCRMDQRARFVLEHYQGQFTMSELCYRYGVAVRPATSGGALPAGGGAWLRGPDPSPCHASECHTPADCGAGGEGAAGESQLGPCDDPGVPAAEISSHPVAVAEHDRCDPEAAGPGAEAAEAPA
jgi:hypothetical protein